MHHIFVFVLTLSSCFRLSLTFEFHDCGADDAVVRFEEASVKPDTIVFGGEASVAAKMHVRKEVKSGVSRIHIYRLIRVLGVTIPIRIPCVWGTCDVNFCKDIGPGTMFCQWLKQSNRTCGCPLRPDTIKTNDLVINLPPVKPIYAMILSGLYRIKWTWIDDAAREVGCVTADLSLASKSTD